MALMRLPVSLERWLSGWVELTRHDAVPGYAGRGRRARLALDLAALAVALGSGGTWFAGLLALAAGLAALLLAWDLDLTGWQRDAVLCLPAVLVAPWVAGGRRRHIGELLARHGTAPATTVTDAAGALRHSPGCSTTTQEGQWQQTAKASTPASTPGSAPASTPGSVAAPPRRWWRLPALPCWRRLRFPASARPDR